MTKDNHNKLISLFCEPQDLSGSDAVVPPSGPSVMTCDTFFHYVRSLIIPTERTLKRILILHLTSILIILAVLWKKLGQHVFLPQVTSVTVYLIRYYVQLQVLVTKHLYWFICTFRFWYLWEYLEGKKRSIYLPQACHHWLLVVRILPSWPFCYLLQSNSESDKQERKEVRR